MGPFTQSEVTELPVPQAAAEVPVLQVARVGELPLRQLPEVGKLPMSQVPADVPVLQSGPTGEVPGAQSPTVGPTQVLHTWVEGPLPLLQLPVKGT